MPFYMPIPKHNSLSLKSNQYSSFSENHLSFPTMYSYTVWVACFLFISFWLTFLPFHPLFLLRLCMFIFSCISLLHFWNRFFFPSFISDSWALFYFWAFLILIYVFFHVLCNFSSSFLYLYCSKKFNMRSTLLKF